MIKKVDTKRFFSLSRRPDPWFSVTSVIATLVLMPVVMIALSVFCNSREIWVHLKDHLLGELLLNSFFLSSGVLGITFVLGVSLAYFTTLCEFPGRSFFSRALLLPLAVPAYVMAFVYTGLLDFSGPVQAFLRMNLPELAPLFPEIRSTGGVIFVISLTLYPYVFLLSASGFSSQGENVVEAARSMGMGRLAVFFRVVLPMARPWIFGGLLLVLMETLADFGAVSMFNYDTFTTAIYKAWFGFFSMEAAAQLASVLVLMVLLVIAVETRVRRKMRFFQDRACRPIQRIRLRGISRFLVTAYLILVLAVAFVVPLGQLLLWTVRAFAEEFGTGYIHLVANTLSLGLMGALFTMACAVVIAYSERACGHVFLRVLARLSMLGYALPGTVLAVGMVRFVSAADNIFISGVELFGLSFSGQVLQGSVLLMPLSYMVRFLSAGYSSVSSSIGRITPSMDEAARSMGAGRLRLLREVHLPLIKGGVLTGMLLVFIDIMKEMPLTLMTRPFGYDTLAVKIFELTSEGEWERAALPAVTLVLAGMIPVFFLSRQIHKKDEENDVS